METATEKSQLTLEEVLAKIQRLKPLRDARAGLEQEIALIPANAQYLISIGKSAQGEYARLRESLKKCDDEISEAKQTAHIFWDQMVNEIETFARTSYPEKILKYRFELRDCLTRAAEIIAEARTLEPEIRSRKARLLEIRNALCIETEERSYSFRSVELNVPLDLPWIAREDIESGDDVRILMSIARRIS